MAANTSIVLTELDFGNLKESLKSSMKSQSLFKDYDFEGSSLNVILDVLAHNTYLNTFYLNMVGSEMWMDSAQIRDSVVSHAKDINYLPRSFISAEAVVNIRAQADGSNQASIVLPKGSTFTGRAGQQSFTFTTDKNIVAYRQGNEYIAEGISLFEGNYVGESFVVDNSLESQAFKLSNKNADIRSLKVTVIEDNGSTVIEYLQARTLLGLNEQSPVFFVQAALADFYEVIFADAVVGRKPKDNSIVLLEYRLSNGELPNGINNFKLDSNISGTSSVTVEVVQPAAGGLISEDINSIKFNAPRAFTTQERAVTAEDYENLLKINFPEVNVVSAYGGEEADPPQFGKVVLSVDIKGFDGLPRAKETTYRRFLKERAPLSIDPIFVQPEFIYLAVDTTVKYNINLTGLTTSDIKTLVISQILNYKTQELDDFKVKAKYSRITTAIDSAHSSVDSNDTNILALKYVKPSLGRNVLYDINFYQAIEKPIIPVGELTKSFTDGSVYSNAFISGGKTTYLMDDGLGGIRMVTLNDQGQYARLRNVGTIDYATGKIQIFSLNITRMLSSNVLKIYARTVLKDITSSKNVILTINEEDINVTVEQIRE